jgi:hypothetical protein
MSTMSIFSVMTAQTQFFAQQQLTNIAAGDDSNDVAALTGDEGTGEGFGDASDTNGLGALVDVLA